MSHRFPPDLRCANMTFAASSARRSARPTPMRSAAASAPWSGAAAARRVAVGHDGRESSPVLEEALVRGLTESGVDVVRVGLGPTPMLYYAEAVLDVDGGIMITGSHNPANYNGFKMVLRQQRLLRRGHPEARADGRGAATGTRAAAAVSDEPMLEDRYVDRLLQDFDGGALPDRLGRRQRRRRPGAREAGRAAAGRASPALHRRRQPLSQPSSRSDRGEESRRPQGAGRARRGSISASPSTATATGSARSTARAG